MLVLHIVSCLASAVGSIVGFVLCILYLIRLVLQQYATRCIFFEDFGNDSNDCNGTNTVAMILIVRVISIHPLIRRVMLVVVTVMVIGLIVLMVIVIRTHCYC